ncbi:MAG: DUF1659 domain-containing protein [Clostridiales bacterium]|nr:DUF1659 domain-containing protein [Clostridiales bacterium]
MAVETSVLATKLRIKYLGNNVDGKQSYITKTYSNVNPEAEDEDIYEVSGILTSLQTKVVYNVCRLQDVELAEA